ncbi:PSD1 and planctomycete cytochrome C domain-containing protein [Sediminicola luteus]|nr:PSD1 and planctomycete cytochrome C domain-containing protein [Sediminicola luteus]
MRRTERLRTMGGIGLLCGLVAFMACNQGQKASGNSGSDLTEVRLPEKVDFTFDIKPILSDRCFACHGPDQNAIEGGLSLHTAETAYAALGELKDHAAIVPGDTQKSSLVARINATDATLRMPPPESNLSLTDYEKRLLEKWIEQGAEYKPHWAFVAPEPQEVPTKTDWAQNEIDAFVFETLQEKGLQPSDAASKEKLIRRVSFDLTGLPPSPKDIAAFVKDQSAKAFEKVVDRLLASQDYAEHMAAEWMDIARYADTHGYQDDFERTMWPWRDWVIHAFNENLSYKDFVTQQLAGDLIPNASLDQILATGFNRNHKITGEGGVIPEEYRVEYVEDRTNTFGTAFLGLTMECARCHDHKYDPISQKEHFELFSFFNNVPEAGLVPSGVIPVPVINLSQKEVDGVLDFVNFTKSEGKTLPIMVMEEMEKPRQAYILNRGLYDQHGDAVAPNTPKALLDFPAEFPKNRLGLAQWLFHSKNPLTARVAVNRLWQRMFGQGLVASSYDFGNQGALPTHPELLDYLALKFQNEGWDMKALLKYMALSATYQQTTKLSDELLEKDPENLWLARASRLRLPAETIRDQALLLSGLLHKEVGGPSVKPYQPEGIWEETTGGGGGTTASYVLGTGNELYRKSLYTFWKRTVPPPSMMTFDASSRDICSVKRQETNTPLQALILLNDPQLIEAARVMAQSYVGGPSDVGNQISSIFEKATSRKPQPEELQQLEAFYADALQQIEAQELLPEAYLSIGMAQVPDGIDKKQLTALAVTVQTILNLDETISRG